MDTQDDPQASPTPARPRRGWREQIVRLLALVATLYLVVVVLLAFFQGWLIFPGQSRKGEPEGPDRVPAGCELVTLRAPGGERIVAIFGPALDPFSRPRGDAKSRPTLLFFYGNGENLGHALGRFSELRRLGMNVMIPDYLGYGLSEGRPSEAGCYAVATAAYDHLLTRSDIDPARIVTGGSSLGGAVAIDLAARRPVIGLMSFSAFTSMSHMVRRRYPFVPTFLLVHKFASLRKIATVKVPTLIGHGRADTLVPFAMADRLAAAAAGPVTRVSIAGAGHNDLFEVGGNPIDAAIRQFVDGLPGNPRP